MREDYLIKGTKKIDLDDVVECVREYYCQLS